MPITHADISTDEDLGRRVIARARVIAPCLATLDPESEEGLTAIALLKGVVGELPSPGERRVRSVSRNGTAVSLDAIVSAFDSDTVASLRALCGSTPRGALPMGSFPTTPAFGTVWPEGPYS